MDYEELEKKIKELKTIPELQELLPSLAERRLVLMDAMRIEDSKLKRDEIHDELFEVKTFQGDIKYKIMAIAHVKIRKPRIK